MGGASPPGIILSAWTTLNLSDGGLDGGLLTHHRGLASLEQAWITRDNSLTGDSSSSFAHIDIPDITCTLNVNELDGAQIPSVLGGMYCGICLHSNELTEISHRG